MVKNLPAMLETQELKFGSLTWEASLEEEKATHSSILAWKIPWTEESGELQSMGSHWRSRHESYHRRIFMPCMLQTVCI